MSRIIDATPLPIDVLGNPMPIGHWDTGNTNTITIVADNVPVAGKVFSKTGETLAYYANGTLLIQSKLKPAPKGRDIKLVIATASGAGSIAVSGNTITIIPSSASGQINPTAIAALINASDAAKALVSVTSNGTAELNPKTVETYLKGYDPGNQVTVVRIQATADGFIGTYPESEIPLASMPITAGQSIDMIVLPNQKISYKAAAGSICYVTPFKKY